MKTRRPNPVELTEKRPSWTPRLSLVVPTYNVAPYFAYFLESVFNQNSQTRRFEVIIVDDGSTDGSDEIALAWAKNYPDHIRYIWQDNHGLSEARNTGLAAARGTWVSFPDPDDFLDPNYFRVILEQTVIAHEKPLLMIVAKLLPYDDVTGSSMDNHPLNYRFRAGLSYVDTSDMGDFFHLSAASCWFDRATLVRQKLRFNPRVKPVFEDGHLVSKLLMLSPDRTIAVVPKAVYNYRKRADGSSLVMSAKVEKGFYLDTLEYGYLDLIHFAKATLGRVPRFVQRICLYELQSRVKHLTNNDPQISLLTTEEIDCFIRLLNEIFKDISIEVIKSFQVGRFNNQDRIGLIGQFKSEEADSDLLYIEKYDPITRLARFSYFLASPKAADVRLECRGRKLRLTDQFSNTATFAGEDYLVQHWLHVRLPKSGEIDCYIDDIKMTPRHNKRNMQTALSHKSLQAFLTPAAPAQLSDADSELRQQILEMPRTFDGAWLLMGSPMVAGDDAPALYRHLQKSDRAQNTWFVLSVLSPDWAELMAAGFKLLPYGNPAHLAALVQADLLITTSVDAEQNWPVDATIFADQTGLRTVVLPQETQPKVGVGGYLCVPSQRTAEAVTNVEAGTHWFSAELIVSGFPRHDGLKRKRRSAKTVVFAADWLRDMSTETGENALTRKPFEATDIAAYRGFWKAIFESDALAQCKIDHKLTFRAVVGRRMAHELGALDPIDEVLVHEPGAQEPLKAGVLAQAGLVVTDMPTVAFDAAFYDCQSLLGRQNLESASDPMPAQIHLHGGVEAIVAQIAEHYNRSAKAPAADPYFPEDTTTVCARITTALEKIATR